MNTFNRLPFSYKSNESFFEKLNDWIGDLFYDVFPEAGMELRDEQIFMAFQLEKAFQEKKVMFAEAGVGTGKTIAYLLYSICYARYMRKPVIIACADESLIEQLVKEDGDIAKLERLLNMNIDARLAKSKDQYVCLNKLDDVRQLDDYDEAYDDIYFSLPDFVFSNETMQSFYHYGDRKEYPGLSDDAWEKIGWDSFQDCFVCEQRHRCGQTLSRDYYRKATDLIICSHDFYMEHVWTSEARKREGQLPLLPEGSAIVFDEGHLLEVAAQKALTYRLRHDVLEEILTRLLENDVRENFAVLIEGMITQSFHMNFVLEQNIHKVLGSNRYELVTPDAVKREFAQMLSLIERIEDEIVFESELYTIDEYQLRIVEEHLEMIHKAIAIFIKEENAITWVEKDENGLTFVIMPRLVEEVLAERVFSQKIPFVFSSATLSTDEKFDFIAQSLGIRKFLSFSVDSPFDYDEQMKIIAPKMSRSEPMIDKMAQTKELLTRTNGKALILFKHQEQLAEFRKYLEEMEDFKQWSFLFEGDAEITQLISTFQRETDSILCAVHLWEGLDIPGEALKNVIIWSLPYPPEDPVFMAKREASKQPFTEVELPYMILRLRQGIGRLIRTHDDEGVVAILDEHLYDNAEALKMIERVVPVKISEQL